MGVLKRTPFRSQDGLQWHIGMTGGDGGREGSASQATAGGIVEKLVLTGVGGLALVAVFFSNGQAAMSVGGPSPVKWDTVEQVEAHLLKVREANQKAPRIIRPSVDRDVILKGRRITSVVIGSKNGGGLGYLKLVLDGDEQNPVEIGNKKDSVGLQTHDTKLNTSGILVGVGWIVSKDVNALDLAFLPKVTGIKDVYDISQDAFNQNVVARDENFWVIDQKTTSADAATKVSAEHEFEWTYEKTTTVESTTSFDHMVTQGAHVNVKLEGGLAAGDGGGPFGSVSAEAGYSWEKSVSEHLSKVNTRETKETTKKRTKFTFEGLSNKKVMVRAARFQTSFQAIVKRTLDLDGPGEFKFSFPCTVDSVDQTVIFIKILESNEPVPTDDDWAGFRDYAVTKTNTASLVAGRG